MFILICYDIEDDKLRKQVADVLEAYGRRVQFSVFECRLETKRFETLKAKLDDLITRKRPPDTTCSLRFYPLCAACTRRFQTLGDEEALLPEVGYYVV